MEADHPGGHGYKRICINGRNYASHRVIWLMVHGRWPLGEIDHINAIRDDNRLCNLREVERRENAKNRTRSQRNTSDINGVYKPSHRGQWYAAIGGKFIGSFDTKAEAAEARSNAQKEDPEYTGRHGTPIKGEQEDLSRWELDEWRKILQKHPA